MKGPLRNRIGSVIAATLCVAAMLAAGEAGRPAAEMAATKPAAGAWPIFRGDPALSGLAAGELPDKPVLLWQFKTGACVRSSPVIADGKVFVGSDDSNVYAIDLHRGTKLWACATGDAVQASPCVAAGKVYVGSSDGSLYCLGIDGAPKWKYKTEDRILGSANFLRVKDPKAKGGWSARVVVGSYDNKLHCIDADRPVRLWTYETTNWINGAPATAGGRIVFGGCDAVVHVVSAADGKPLATIETGSFIAASAALAGDEAYVGQFAGKLLRVDLAAGKIVWSYGDGENAFFSAPAIDAQRVVVGCRDQAVHCVSRKDGKKLWTFPTGGQVDSSPVICGGKVVVGSGDGRLYILNLADGKKLWSYDLGGAITSSPAVAGGMIVVGCEDGAVYAFGPEKN